VTLLIEAGRDTSVKGDSEQKPDRATSLKVHYPLFGCDFSTSLLCFSRAPVRIKAQFIDGGGQRLLHSPRLIR